MQQLKRHPPQPPSGPDLLADLAHFSSSGRPTETHIQAGIPTFTNAFWTARQRQSHSLHEISYRACFKAELPRFFIERLSAPGECVYDPFMGRGTTLLEAALLGRAVAGNDVNPLSRMLIAPRLAPPTLEAVRAALEAVPWNETVAPEDEPLLAFYHPRTLGRIRSLRDWLIARERGGDLDPAAAWIRMVALNRLTGHSSGFFSVYTLPPNQAVSVAAQRRINARRGQSPPERDVAEIILKKSASLLRDGTPGPAPILVLTGARAWEDPGLAAGSVALIVTSPPFLDVVAYARDNWLRNWFAGLDPTNAVRIDGHRSLPAWRAFVARCFAQFARVVRPGGHVAFEVGEVRKGGVRLEEHVRDAVGEGAFRLIAVLVNDQAFTKTAHCWGVANNARGTNTNRVLIFQRK